MAHVEYHLWRVHSRLYQRLLYLVHAKTFARNDSLSSSILRNFLMNSQAFILEYSTTGNGNIVLWLAGLAVLLQRQEVLICLVPYFVCPWLESLLCQMCAEGLDANTLAIIDI